MTLPTDGDTITRPMYACVAITAASSTTILSTSVHAARAADGSVEARSRASDALASTAALQYRLKSLFWQLAT